MLFGLRNPPYFFSRFRCDFKDPGKATNHRFFSCHPRYSNKRKRSASISSGYLRLIQRSRRATLHQHKWPKFQKIRGKISQFPHPYKKKKQGAFHEISPTFKDLCMFFRFWGKSNTRSHYNSPWYDVFSTSWKNLAHLGKTQMILNFLSLPHTQHELRSKPVCSIRGPYHGFLYIPTYYIYITGWYNPESPVDTTRQSIHPPLPPPPSETRKLQVIQGLSPFLAQTFFWPGSLPKGF